MDRINWFISTRWFAALLCVVLWGVSHWSWPGIVHLPKLSFIWSAIALALLNTIYYFFGKNILSTKASLENSRLTRVFIRVQILLDFLVLSYLNYVTGTIESPFLVMFVPHIILACIFLSRRESFSIVIFAWFYAALPLMLEYAGILPCISIFDGHFKHLVLEKGTLLPLAFFFAIGLGYVITWYIITEITVSLKMREKQLEEAYHMLKHMDKEKTQATLRATHELKAPFAAIKSYVYTLRDGYCGELPERAAKVVDRIGERCDRLRDKISAIIHLSNIKTLVVSDINLKPVNLIDILKAEAHEGALRGRERKIEVRFRSDLSSVYVNGSRPHLTTLFSNLIRNAVNYSKNDQVVDVEVVEKRDEVSVSVIDSGIGISSDALEKIFDEHFRSNQAVAHNPNGTGLGLPMVKELVRLHGAVLAVESEVGVGSTFKVTFKTVILKTKGENNE
ncbi:MAG: hypothetical protein CSA81_06300 [Acidobacteria bacterium]|nr:MAG: hypothetical protein CSA81_06300 [Acidobacteriota bacterium]